MTIKIYNDAWVKILTAMESSTGHHYSATELVAKTGLSKPTVLSALKELRAAEFVCKYPEPKELARKQNRPQRKGYELQTNILIVLRVVPESET